MNWRPLDKQGECLTYVKGLVLLVDHYYENNEYTQCIL